VLLGYALNDAGVVVPGLMLGVLVCTLVPLVVVPSPDVGLAPSRTDDGAADVWQPDRDAVVDVPSA
jgi:hypothetical protein